MMHLYKTLVKNQKISFENFEKVMHNIYLKYNQAYIAQALGMDQSTISRKLNEIRKYIIIKLREVK